MSVSNPLHNIKLTNTNKLINNNDYIRVDTESDSNIIIDDEDDAVEISLQGDNIYNNNNNNQNINNNNNNNNNVIINKLIKIKNYINDLWNTVTFSFVKPLLELGNQRPLEQSDLLPLNEEDTSMGVFNIFNEKWKKEINTNNPSLILTYILAFGGPFFNAGLVKLIHDSCLFISPLMLNHLIYFLSDPNQPLIIGIYYVIIIFCANIIMSLCLRQYFYYCYITGMRLRSAVITAVYNKSLILCTAALNSRNSGEIMNLMAVDATRMQELTPYLHALWYSFYQIGLAIYFLWAQVSYAALAGVAVIIILIPLTNKVSSYLKDIQKDISKIRDERVKVTNEILAGMKVIKFQAWEQEFEQRIITLRKEELRLFRKYIMLQSYSSALYTSIPLIVAITTFTTYVMIMGKTLTIAKALTALALFDILRFPLFVLPNVLNNVIEAKVSIDRIQSFLLEPDLLKISTEIPNFNNNNNINNNNNNNNKDNTKYGIFMDKASLVCDKLYNSNKNKNKNKNNKINIWYDTTNGINYNNNIFLRIYHLIYSSILTLYYLCKNFCIKFLRKSYGTAKSQLPINNINYDLFQFNDKLNNTSNISNISNNTNNTNNMNINIKNNNIIKDMYNVQNDDIEDNEYSSREFSYHSQLTTQMMLLREAEVYIDDLEFQLDKYHIQNYKTNINNIEYRFNNSNLSNNNFNNNNNNDNTSLVHSIQESNALMESLQEDSDDLIAISSSSTTNLLNNNNNNNNKLLNDNDKNKNIKTNIPLNKPSDILTLSRIHLSVKPGELIAIVGPVGCGKSSVLKSLLGDLRLCYGTVAMNGNCSYVSQKPFIQNATLRENILFGLSYNENKYKNTLFMCALLPDLEVLPAGDLTEIGERGINLSGGQKTRVALARAVYSDSDIYLLDDPLAAVDAHVGQHLFTKCIKELQKQNKCILLVTNALQFTKACNKIYVLNDGRITECGTYFQLLQNGTIQNNIISSHSTFYNMIHTYMESASDITILDEDNIINNTNNIQYKENKENKSRSNSNVNIIVNNNTSNNNNNNNNNGKLVTAEDREVGNVDMKIYWIYLLACGGIKIISYLIIIYLIAEFINVAASWWLSFWSENSYHGTPFFYLTIYILINIMVALASLYREIEIRLRCLDASMSLYMDLLKSILYAPMSFFDTTPLGRIINRFSKDIYTIDEQLPATIRMYVGSLTKVCGVLLYTSIVTPFFIISLIPVAIFYLSSQKYYIQTSRELSRLENISRSPIYALFSETIDGMTTIRAFNAQDRFISRNNKLLDNNQQAYYLNFTTNCWLAVRLEFAGTIIVTFAALTAVLSRQNLKTDSGVTHDNYSAFAGMAGLAISLSLSITQSLNWTVRMASSLESQMISVERVSSYSTNIKQEAAYIKLTDPNNNNNNNNVSVAINTLNTDDDIIFNNTSSGLEMQNIWPNKGIIEFRNVCLRYREGLPLVLNNCNFTIQSSEKIGVVGRTGAGKSSLVTALLRLVELEENSNIYIDDVDISTLGLKTLRSNITVIPQDPVLFSGTIRQNLDPFQKYTDEQIWQSLKRVSKENNNNTNNTNNTNNNTFVKSLLDKVEENGSNYSVGQRQLLCIARALLTKSKIIVMDEATAAIDIETDAAIQKTIRTQFLHATCITIAHRLNTIMDCDKILVMENGHVAEFDSPQNLLSKPTSLFSALVMNWESSNK